ncbi:MAG: ABC transporter permease [Planctomycetota bacterium]|jgi:putative ABC transport system permease protein|nr:ABC transporter permease [Planctomycetota bacterium]
MFLRLLKGALLGQRRKLALVALTMALGVSLATAMLAVLLDVGDKVNRELKAYGANLNVVPRGASLLADLHGLEDGSGIADKYLAENELGRLRTIFWSHNIVDFTPYLDMTVGLEGKGGNAPLIGTWFAKNLTLPTGETTVTGMSRLKSWWTLEGAWPDDADRAGAMLGRTLAEKFGLRPGDRLTVAAPDGRRRETLTIRAVFHGGGDEDEAIYVPISLVQELSNRPGLVRRVEVSALTTPENDLARRAARDPSSLTPKEWDAWYCTAYISSIAYQIEEVLTDARAKPVLRVAESEGAILNKVSLLMLLLTILSLAGSALAISNLVTAGVMERSAEIGLAKAVGAEDRDVILLFLAEIMVTALAGGIIGYAAGLGFAQLIGRTVFGTAIALRAAVPPLVAVMVAAVSLLGSVPALKMLAGLRPADVLHGR